MILYATGAYGRKATLADWDAGKDFTENEVLNRGGPWVGGKYFSRRDGPLLRGLGYTEIRFTDPGNQSFIGWRIDL